MADGDQVRVNFGGRSLRADLVTAVGTGYTPKGYQQIADATLAAATALTVPAGSTYAVVQNNGSQPVRYRDDGTDPTTTVGMRIPAGNTLTYDGNLAAIKFIREAAGVTLDVTYYG